VHQGKYAEAGAELAQAIALLPDSAALHLNYAYCLLRVGRLHEALAESELALRLQPGFSDAVKIERAIRASLGQ
jgi:predicted Zn-dependent protease